jgi:endonuclease IV
MNKLLGYHISQDYNESFGFLPVIQYFSPKDKHTELIKFPEKMIKYIHAPYTIQITSHKNIRSCAILANELIYAHVNGCSGIVLHAGSRFVGYENNIIDNIKTAYKFANSKLHGVETRILIENMAPSGRLVLTNIDQIISLHKKISTSDIRDRVSFCYDTCHDYVSDNQNPAKNLMKLLAAGVQISLIHLNNSMSKSIDMHDSIDSGYIPYENLKEIYEIGLSNRIPMIIEHAETPETQRRQISELTEI